MPRDDSPVVATANQARTEVPDAAITTATSQSLLARLLPFLRERRFQAGDRLPSERDLAQRFSVSRSNVREAIAILEAHRVVECRPQSGVYLRSRQHEAALDAMLLEQEAGLPLTVDDVRDLHEFRQMLEVRAVVAATTRRTSEDIARMDAVLRTSAARLNQGLSIADQDAHFHLALIEAGHNQLLVRTANWFYLLSGKRREHYFANRMHARRSLNQHIALRDAVERRDTTRAVELLNKHLEGMERYWSHTLETPDKAASTRTTG
jgi:GntR family transcriptional repressor for pyruvate dehydrogenase complex